MGALHHRKVAGRQRPRQLISTHDESMNPGRLPRWTIAAGLGVALLALLVVLAHRHTSSTPTTVNGGNGGLPARPAGSSTAAPLPGPVPTDDLAQAKLVAGKYVQAAHAADYRSISSTSRLSAAKPFMTTNFYQRSQDRNSASSGSNSDAVYLAQFRANRIQVFVTVKSAAVASGDGDDVTANDLQMRLYYTTTTISATDQDGTVSAETPTTLNLRKTSHGWLVDGADGA
jgi:hypothetical protein